MPALELLANDGLSCRVDAVNLKDILGDVETEGGDRGKLLQVGSSEPLVASAATDSPAQSRREEPSTTSYADEL